MNPTRPLIKALWLTAAIFFLSTSSRGQQTLISVNGWNAYVHLPDDYKSTGSQTYPTIIFFPGTGEVGTNPGSLLIYGPGYFIANGWNGQVTMNGTAIKPIIICLQPPAVYPAIAVVDLQISALEALYRIDPTRLALTGLSMGGWVSEMYVESYPTKAASVCAIQAVKPDDNPAYPAPFGTYALDCGHWLGYEQLYDNRDMLTIANTMNAAVAGSATYFQTDVGGGGHCCWNTWYDPTHTDNYSLNGVSGNWSIYQFMLTWAGCGGGVKPPPNVNAGNSQTITLPANSVSLTGTASGKGKATITSVTWSESSGPNSATIVSPASLSTAVDGLIAGTYLFTLTATDNNGNSSSASVSIVVNPALPPLTNAGSAQSITLPTNSVTLSGTASGQNGATIASTLWTQTSGPSGATIGSPSNLSTSVTGLLAGVYVFGLTATDDYGLSSSSSVTITVNAGTPPTVNAGNPQTITLPTNSVTLTGTASGNNGATIVSSLWREVSGPASSIVSPTSLSTSVTGLTAGSYLFELSATDNNGLSGSSYISVTVNSSGNIAPTVSAGANQSISLPSSTVTLTGTASGNGGASIVSTQWTETSGPNVATIATPASLSTGVSGLIAGSYTFDLTATDSHGLSVTAAVAVIVSPSNMAPTVSAGPPQTISLPTSSVTLTGSASGNNGATIVSVLWIQLTGAASIIVSPTNLTTSISGLTAGSYFYKLTATDNNGLTNYAYVSVTVNNAGNMPPTVNAGANQTISAPASSVNLSGTATANGGDVLVSTTWAQASGPGLATIGSASSLTTAVTGLFAGSYTFDLTATDNQGLSTTSAVTITVNPANVPPTVNAGSPQTITLPTNSVTLTGTATGNSGATIVSALWIQITGAATTITTPPSLSTTVTGFTAGSFLYKLTVTDNNGLSNAAYVSVTVDSAVMIPPTVSVGPNQTIALPTNAVTLTGTASGNGGAAIVSTLWTEISGAASTLGTPAQLSTTVTGLVAGAYVFKLTATDNNGQTGAAFVSVTVNPQPLPPTVSAGSDQTIILPLDSVRLNGTATGNGGASIVTSTWSQSSGPNTATIESGSSLSTTVSGLIKGVYVFTLSATDNGGLSSSSTVSVTINQIPNQPPVANAGSNQTVTLPDSTVILNGSASYDPDGTIVFYSWTELSGPSTATFNNSNTPTTTAGKLVVGTYVFQLSVTDNSGATTKAQVTVQVVAIANQPPVANAGTGQTIQLPLDSVSLNGSKSTDPDGSIVSYSWSELSGPSTATITGGSAVIATAGNLVAGTYIFSLSVTDNSGASSTAQVTIQVLAALSQPPVANAGAGQTIQLPLDSVSLNGSKSNDPDGSIVSYSWSELSGPSTATITGGSTVIAIAGNLVAGTYIFNLMVTDNSGASSTAQVTIQVQAVQAAQAQPPIANAGPDQSVQLPLDSVVLDGSKSYDPQGYPLTYSWVEISGPGGSTIVNSTTATPYVAGLKQGKYTFQLTVTDTLGLQGSALVTITVAGVPAGPLVANAGQDTTIFLPVDSTILNGSRSSGSIASYQWTEISGPSMAGVSAPDSAVSKVDSLVIGTYVFQLTVVDDSGTQSLSTVKVVVANNPQFTESIVLYPDPVVDEATLKLVTDSLGKVQISIYDMAGRLVQLMQMGKVEVTQTTQLHLRRLAPGMYVLQAIIGDHKRMSTQFMRQ